MTMPKTTKKIVHMALDIAGALRWPDDMLLNLLEQPINPGISAHEVRKELQRRLDAGEELMPMCGCKGFDPLTGCPGSEVDDPTK